MQAKSTFSLIQAAMMTDMNLDGNAMSRMEDIYSHVIENLETSDFRQNKDPNDQADMYQAQGKIDVLNGLYTTLTDPQGRSSLMSSFLALAMTSDEFRKVLSTKSLPKTAKSTDKTLDNMVTGVAPPRCPDFPDL